MKIAPEERSTKPRTKVLGKHDASKRAREANCHDSKELEKPMFTGIIEEIGHVTRVENRRMTVSSSQLVKELKQGDSIAVSGVCLTALDITPNSFTADLAEETWKRTSFSRIKKGALVNLELPMQANGRFGGHIVQGHVDGAGQFLALTKVSSRSYALHIEIPKDLARYVIFKGSLCIEGISLTVAAIEGMEVTVAIIPHTVKMTNLQSLKPGEPVNLEVDVIAKYVEKMLRGESGNSAISIDELVREGF
jgi:riboflavin synthase